MRLYSMGDGFTSSSATTTAADGSYSFGSRPQGVYRVWFRDVSRQGWASEYFEDAPDLGSASNVILGVDPQTVSAELDPIR